MAASRPPRDGSVGAVNEVGFRLIHLDVKVADSAPLLGMTEQ